MTHPSPQELHEIAYGLAPRPSHLEYCERCREDLAAIDAERVGLQDVLKEDFLAAPAAMAGGPRKSVWNRAIPAAVAGLLLGLLVVILWRPGTVAPTRAPDDVEQLLDRIEKLSAEVTRLEVEIEQLEMIIKMNRNYLDPEWWKKQSEHSKPANEKK